jgi:hypothetical protein
MTVTSLARASSNCKQQTSPLGRKDTPNATNLQLSDRKEDFILAQRWVLDTKIHRLTLTLPVFGLRLRGGRSDALPSHSSCAERPIIPLAEEQVPLPSSDVRG